MEFQKEPIARIRKVVIIESPGVQEIGVIGVLIRPKGTWRD
jgi:hypothetical protein